MASEEGFYTSLGNSWEVVTDDGLSDSSWDYVDGHDEEELDKKHCIILKEETMKRLQQNDISEVSNVLAVTRGVACALLLRKKWSVSSVFEEWFADEDAARAAFGLPTEKNEQRKLQNTYCGICMDTIVFSRAFSASCGHLFCSECWARYVAASIDAGPECLTLRCPEPNCASVAGLHVVEALAAPEDKLRFDRYLFRSYVESSRNRKWCPRPGCDFVVEFGGGEEETVICRCGYKFCWGCREEHHHPVGCDTVANWGEKIRKIEKSPRMLRYTKFCPNCTPKFERNCDHCYERWALNYKWGEIARSDAAWMRRKYLPEIAAAQGVEEAELQFVVEAWEQMVECRRVLKWSYAYGYYVKEDRKKREALQRRQLFVEAALETLRGYAEKEMAEIVGGGRREAEFGGFREKLVDITAVTKRHVENLVRALEHDLSQDYELAISSILVLLIVFCLVLLHFDRFFFGLT